MQGLVNFFLLRFSPEHLKLTVGGWAEAPSLFCSHYCTIMTLGSQAVMCDGCERYQAPRSSPISLSGRNPQNQPQIHYNLSLKSAIPDKLSHVTDVTLLNVWLISKKKIAWNAYYSPSSSCTANKTYYSLPYVYKSTITGIRGFRAISSLCFESLASCLPEFSTSIKSSMQLVL